MSSGFAMKRLSCQIPAFPLHMPHDFGADETQSMQDIKLDLTVPLWAFQCVCEHVLELWLGLGVVCGGKVLVFFNLCF